MKFTVFMFVFLLQVSFTLDYNSNSETKISRKIYLQEAIEFCQRSSDGESDFDRKRFRTRSRLDKVEGVDHKQKGNLGKTVHRYIRCG